MGKKKSCDNVPQSRKPRPTRLSPASSGVITLSEKGLFFTIWRIFCAARFLPSRGLNNRPQS
jgi:hypothetical protein